MTDKGRNRLKADMSQEAVDQRLRDVAQLYRLGMSLAGITYLGKAKDLFPPTRTDSKEAETLSDTQSRQ